MSELEQEQNIEENGQKLENGDGDENDMNETLVNKGVDEENVKDLDTAVENTENVDAEEPRKFALPDNGKLIRQSFGNVHVRILW